MALTIKQLSDDHVLLEQIGADDMVNGIYRPNRDPNAVTLARVIATGPGDMNQRGERNPMPCAPGDVVLVHGGAGFRFNRDGREYWIVYGGRKDIVAVVEMVMPLSADEATHVADRVFT